MAEHFYKLRVAEIVPETEEANSIRFDVPEGLEEVFRFRAGQHLSVRAEIGGEEVRRNYSLCVAPDEKQLKVTVKRIAGGVFSNWVGDNLKAGDMLDVMSPHGSFTVDFDQAAKRRYVAFAGGSGITPVMSLIKTALGTEPNSRFTLFYGNRDASSIIFLEALAALKDSYLGRFELYHFLSDEEGDVDLFNGMLDRETCDEALDHLVDDVPSIDAWFICGPGPMMDAAEAALTDRDVANNRI
ncbi:MAG TPA: FAD-binding oxidoreductase, partial [Sphingomicrobium sp.]|nr:FAD-binding oxidoreductase [Sphingomicrobium sp.]